MGALIPPVLIPAIPPPQRAPGLFDVALGPLPMPMETAQGGGITYVPDTCVDDTYLYAINCPPVSGSKTFSLMEVPVSGAPFGVITSYACAPVGWTQEEVRQRLATRMMLWEQRAVERRVWQGWNNSNGQGVQPGLFATATNLGDSACMKVAVARLEQALADNGVAGGYIHARPYMMPWLADAHLIELGGSGGRSRTFFTPRGTPIVFGEGYDGSAPNGSPPASGATAEAMYASGRITIWGSEVSIPPLDQTFDRTNNIQYALAEKVFVAVLECGSWYTNTARDCTT